MGEQPLNGAMNRSLNGRLEQPINGRLEQPLNGAMNRSINGRLEQPLNEAMNRSLNGRLEQRLSRPLDRQLNAALNRRLEQQPLNRRLEQTLNVPRQHPTPTARHAPQMPESSQGFRSSSTTPVNFNASSLMRPVYRPMMRRRIPFVDAAASPNEHEALRRVMMKVVSSCLEQREKVIVSQHRDSQHGPTKAY